MKNLLSLMNPQELVKIYTPIRNEIFRSTRSGHGLIPRKLLDNRSKIARIIEGRYLETNGVFDPKKIVVFDNSQTGYRFSGGKTKSYKGIQKLIDDSGVSLNDGRPGTYVSRRANNGLFPTLASERGYYRKPEAYEEILRGNTGLLDEYFNFEGLMQDRYVIQHDVSASIPYIDLEDPVTKESILDINRDSISELLRLYKDFKVSDLPHPDDAEALIKFLMYGDMYDFSQPFGNAMLDASTAIQFSSARAIVSPVQQYFEGGGNMVIPNTLFGNMPFGGVRYKLNGKEVIKYTSTGSSIFAKLK